MQVRISEPPFSAARFELFVAMRYLRAKRKQAVISVITGISVVGVAAGVMALIVALAINNGFHSTLQRTLLQATAHVSIREKAPSSGIANWQELVEKLRALPHVQSAAPTLYGSFLFSGGLQAEGGVLKGIDPRDEGTTGDLLRHLKEGSAKGLGEETEVPAVILGARLAQEIGATVNSRITVISPQGEMTPMMMRPAYYPFRVAGIFESGFFEIDRAWAFTSIKSVQKILSVGDVANSIEMKVSPVEMANKIAEQANEVIGPDLAATSWMEQNRQILNALQLERIVTVITIGLIQLVAALNILISLVMMVMEKHRDIALLLSMGARREQIRGIFLFQGALIGVVGTVIGLVLGYGISYLAQKYHLLPLDAQVYSLSWVPFEPRVSDGVLVAAGAVAISLLATIYPARSATRILPAEALRYE